MVGVFRSSVVAISVVSSLAGKCTEADKALWIGNAEFPRVIEKAGKKSMGAGRVAQAFLVKHYPTMTKECVGCQVHLLTCGFEECLLECTKGRYSAPCKSCVDRKCLPQYKECLGYSKPEDLPIEPTLDSVMDGK